LLKLKLGAGLVPGNNNCARSLIMDNGLLLQGLEGLRQAPPVANTGEVYWSLQGEREEVSRKLLAEGTVCHEEFGLQESEAATDPEIREWHRGQLESRLRELNDALDRLMDGGYGRCTICREQIDTKRLIANPAASLCIACQRNADGETSLASM
jgi:RNA polymerase-binding transcription factor DksA